MKTNSIIFAVMAVISSIDSVRGSGFDQDAYAKSVSMSFLSGLSVEVLLSDKGGVKRLKLVIQGLVIDLPESEFSDLNDVDLQSIRVRTGSRGDESGSEMVAVIISYGADVVIRNPDREDLVMTPSVMFVFSGAEYVARYRASPDKGKLRWETFTKLLGKDEKATQTQPGVANPFTKCGIFVE